MIARTSRDAVQFCLDEGLRSVVTQLGGTDPAASEFGLDASSIRRRLRGEIGWSVKELAAAIAFELQEGGASEILTSLRGLEAQRPAEPLALLGDIEADIPKHCDLIALETVVRSHGGRDLGELRKLVTSCAAEERHLAKVRAEAEAAIAARGGR